MHYFFRIGPGIVDVDLYVVALQVPDNVNNLGIANVGAILFKGDA